MKSKKVEEKSNKKALKEFGAILVVSMIIGFFMGFFNAFADKSGGVENVIASIKIFIQNLIPPVLVFTAILGIVIPVLSYLKCKSMYGKVQEEEENEDLWDTLEEKLSVPLIETNIATIVNLCLFFCGLHIVFNSNYVNDNKIHLIIVAAAGVLAMGSFIVDTVVQSRVVAIEKKLNPEKKGNILDSNFQKIWFDSCDEAQKMTIYKAGYKAFSVTNASCLILFVAAFFIIEFFRLDIFALVLVAVIMGINNITYMVEGAKLERRG